MAMLGKLEDLAEVVDPRSRLGRGLAFLQDCLAGRFPGVVSEIANVPRGVTRRVTVDGDAVYVLLQCYESKRRSEGRFEAHARYTDLQYVWSGRERIEFCNPHALDSKTAYDANGNLFFPMGDTPQSQLLVLAGDVAVFLPQDAHAPSLRAHDGEGDVVRKIVVKIRDAHLPAADAGAAVTSQAPADANTAPGILII
ncbi:MAG TPA: YhcH/YjgK/YiaL family protein [Verrucomicrobiota bacterium]|nr:YhcH/YjgK/YiaL family protein [Verrucomicrobiota bacterium]